METLTQPTLLLKPFAENGDKNAIPLNNETISQPQRADLTVGFPPITSKDPADGGLPPERKDFNALGYLTTTYDYFYQAGGTFTFNSTISNAIGGYPLGARLWYTNSDGVSCILRSTITNNTNDFTQNSSVIGETGSGKPWEVENFRGINSRGVLFDCKWADHIINDISWLRADTFSWQSGAIYVTAYNHLINDIDGKTAITETIGSYTISYYLADDGHKITTDETTVANIYNESGVAWYYILDITNQRFKLPRTKFGFTGLRDSVGKYIEAGLPNITGKNTKTTVSWDDVSGCFSNISTGNSCSISGSTSGHRWGEYTFEASRSNPIYGNSTTVQPPATQMYLYFYVGQYNQSAIEQTAGLNSELFNDKMDRDMSNMNASVTAKETIIGWGMPDYSAAIDIKSYNSSSNQYSAPINGWISVSKNINASFYINGTNFTAPSSQNYGGDNCIIPVKKGTTYYNTGTVAIANFYPCLGG